MSMNGERQNTPVKKRVKKRSLDSLSNARDNSQSVTFSSKSRLLKSVPKSHSILEYFPRKLGGHSKSFDSKFKARSLMTEVMSVERKMEDAKPDLSKDLKLYNCEVDLCGDSDVEMDTCKPLSINSVRVQQSNTERKPILKEINSPKKPMDSINVNCVKDDGNGHSTWTPFSGKYPKRELEESENEDIPEPSEEIVDKLAPINTSPVKFIDVHSFLQVTLDVNGDSPKKSDVTASQSLEPQYYTLKHFRTIMNDILHDYHYAHLFNHEDWQIISKFTGLETPTQALYLKLLVRKPTWKRLSSIKYDDIDHLKTRLGTLVDAGFLLDVEKLVDLDDALNVLDSKELSSLCKSLNLKIKGKTNKVSQFEAIREHIKTSRSISQSFFQCSSPQNTVEAQVFRQIKKILGNTCFKVEKQTSRVFTRIGLIRFPPVPNEEDENALLSQEFFNLYKIDIGELKYVPYRLNKFTVVYPDRENLIKFEEAWLLETELSLAIENKKSPQIDEELYARSLSIFDEYIQSPFVEFDRTLPRYLRRFTAGHVIVRALGNLASYLENKKLHYEAINILEKLINQDIYCLDGRGKWYERLVIDYEKHLKKPETAKLYLIQGLGDEYVRGGPRYTLYLRANKHNLIGTNPKHCIQPFPEYNLPQLNSTKIKRPAHAGSINGRKNLFKSSIDDGTDRFISVEEAALEYYFTEGYIRGIHCEGSIYNTFFCLLLWNCIYNSDEITFDAFHSPYQHVPLDLNYDDFYQRRSSLIDKRIQEITSMTKEEIMNEMTTIWESFEGCQSLVDWERCTLSLLKEIIDCLKTSALAAICDRMARDHKHTRSGLPDLLVWNVSTGRIKAVEVKGPGDSLSAKQVLWIDYLNKHGLEAEVCHVEARRT